MCSIDRSIRQRTNRSILIPGFSMQIYPGIELRTPKAEHSSCQIWLMRAWTPKGFYYQIKTTEGRRIGSKNFEPWAVPMGKSISHVPLVQALPLCFWEISFGEILNTETLKLIYEWKMNHRGGKQTLSVFKLDNSSTLSFSIMATYSAR